MWSFKLYYTSKPVQLTISETVDFKKNVFLKCGWTFHDKRTENELLSLTITLIMWSIIGTIIVVFNNLEKPAIHCDDHHEEKVEKEGPRNKFKSQNGNHKKREKLIQSSERTTPRTLKTDYTKMDTKKRTVQDAYCSNKNNSFTTRQNVSSGVSDQARPGQTQTGLLSYRS